MQPAGPYVFAGHSFGANVCLELVNVAKARGQQVDMIILLDPRSLLPLKVDVAKAFGSSGPHVPADSKGLKGSWLLIALCLL